ncbi:HRDC domain-containing protein [Paenibacillus sp. tmac-D7]|uniref:HRDC domain-containing protein n=1 Tax=Paenibacillus sp. tmac-D7 TaxID=2591462 RepID=UPI00114344D2|nr:HRDC domain-containing protein [Paenibacillus sp. tmac-D7]
MNLIFLNSLEKAGKEGNVRTAQVTIGEQQGIWHIMWTEVQEDGRKTQESWYEGLHWEEMLAVFRERVFAKQCEGFKPLLDIRISELADMDDRTAYTQLLHYYSEQHAEEPLYEALRQWRFKQAASDGKAPFIIATNRLLKMIAAFLPHTEDELRQLPGMGKAKAERYGKDILAITIQQERVTSFPLAWVQEHVNPAEFNTWLLQEKERRRKAEADKLENKRVLLEAISRGEMLDELQEKIRVQRKELLGWIEELDRDGYDLAPYIEQVLEQVPAVERELAWQAFEQQGDRYLKPILQKVYAQDSLSAKEAERIYEWLRLLRLKFRRTERPKQGEAS